MELQKPPQLCDTFLHCLEESCHETCWSGCSGPGFQRVPNLQSLSPKDYKGYPRTPEMFPVWPQTMTFRKLSLLWSQLTVYNWHPSHPWVLLGDTPMVTGTSEVLRPLIQPYLRHIDTSFQKGTVGRIVGAHVTVFAPVARERAVDTCQAAAGENGTVRPRG